MTAREKAMAISFWGRGKVIDLQRFITKAIQAQERVEITIPCFPIAENGTSAVRPAIPCGLDKAKRQDPVV